MFESYELLTFAEAKKNLNRQATKVLHDIAQAYQSGLLDNPNTASHFCGLLACICEGKVRGDFDEETGKIKWSLTPEYSTQLEAIRESAVKAALETGKVVKGPWI